MMHKEPVFLKYGHAVTLNLGKRIGFRASEAGLSLMSVTPDLQESSAAKAEWEEA